MTIRQLLDDPKFFVYNNGGNEETEISGVYCCDLLSCVMGSAPSDCVWVTIMNNINALAVAALTDCAAVMLAAGISPDSAMIAKAQAQGITLLGCDEQIFETALYIHERL